MEKKERTDESQVVCDEFLPSYRLSLANGEMTRATNFRHIRTMIRIAMNQVLM
jgi:hypothetical protein